ncbi:MAG: DUF2946 family protein [Isosphaeraceae bacterium]|nr:DUF2946 family protein [Isosphaeraceae bacterium]
MIQPSARLLSIVSVVVLYLGTSLFAHAMHAGSAAKTGSVCCDGEKSDPGTSDRDGGDCPACAFLLHSSTPADPGVVVLRSTAESPLADRLTPARPTLSRTPRPARGPPAPMSARIVGAV